MFLFNTNFVAPFPQKKIILFRACNWTIRLVFFFSCVLSNTTVTVQMGEKWEYDDNKNDHSKIKIKEMNENCSFHFGSPYFIEFSF